MVSNKKLTLAISASRAAQRAAFRSTIHRWGEGNQLGSRFLWNSDPCGRCPSEDPTPLRRQLSLCADKCVLQGAAQHGSQRRSCESSLNTNPDPTLCLWQSSHSLCWQAARCNPSSCSFLQAPDLSLKPYLHISFSPVLLASALLSLTPKQRCCSQVSPQPCPDTTSLTGTANCIAFRGGLFIILCCHNCFSTEIPLWLFPRHCCHK